MNYTLAPAAGFAPQLNQLIMQATFDIANEWFFYDGAHSGSAVLEQTLSNTWLHENFVAINDKKEIFAYFEAQWSRPMEVIIGFRAINFSNLSGMFVRALFSYFDYLFVNRGCQVLNWTVANQNEHAFVQYERFVQNYCGHKVGLRHYAQKSYTGKISDITLYEITYEEYFEWKARGFSKRNKHWL